VTETKTQYTLVYDRIIEYRKVGDASDDHYEWGIDEIVAEWFMDTWETMTPLETDGNLLSFSATDGMATFNFTLAQTDSVDLTSNKMKIDFLLENYPWDVSGDTFVALVSHIETERKTHIVSDETHIHGVSDVTIDFQDVVESDTVLGFIPFGDYSWATTAEATVTGVSDSTSVNGTDTGDDIAIERMAGDENATGVVSLSDITTETIDVIASSSPTTADSKFTEIAFSFVGAAQGSDRIYWDPEAGVGYQGTSSSAVAGGRVFGSLAVMVLAASLATMVFAL
jgi:hypothetical protein